MRHATLSVEELTVGKFKPGAIPAHGRKVLECIAAQVEKQGGVVTVGVLPAGAVIQKIDVGVRTAFNGTSAALNIGNATTSDAYMATAKITEATVGVYTFLPGVAALTAETTVWQRLQMQMELPATRRSLFITPILNWPIGL